MAELMTLLDHLKGTGIYVNGTIYPIDEAGVARGISDVDAKKLLTSRQWMQADPQAMAERELRRKALREDFKRKSGGMSLIDSSGALVGAESTPAAPPEPATPVPTTKAVGTPEIAAPPPVAPMSEPMELSAPLGTAPADSQVNGAEDEWPTPSMDMTKAYLQEMADAYEVKYHKTKTSKQELVDRNHAAMYGPLDSDS